VHPVQCAYPVFIFRRVANNKAFRLTTQSVFSEISGMAWIYLIESYLGITRIIGGVVTLKLAH